MKIHQTDELATYSCIRVSAWSPRHWTIDYTIVWKFLAASCSPHVVRWNTVYDEFACQFAFWNSTFYLDLLVRSILFGNCTQIIPSFSSVLACFSQEICGRCALSGNEFELFEFSCRPFLEKSIDCIINPIPMWKNFEPAVMWVTRISWIIFVSGYQILCLKPPVCKACYESVSHFRKSYGLNLLAPSDSLIDWKYNRSDGWVPVCMCKVVVVGS